MFKTSVRKKTVIIMGASGYARTKTIGTLRKWAGCPAEVAAAIAFLVSDEAS